MRSHVNVERLSLGRCCGGGVIIMCAVDLFTRPFMTGRTLMLARPLLLSSLKGLFSKVKNDLFHQIKGEVKKKKNLLFPDIAMDWSDHAVWWPQKNVWLDQTRWTLDQYNVTADASLHFTPMKKALRVQLPDLRYMDAMADFSVNAFNAVAKLCAELGTLLAYEKGKPFLSAKMSDTVASAKSLAEPSPEGENDRPHFLLTAIN